MGFIRTIRGLCFDADEQIIMMLTAADVNALYSSIQLERGMAALRWSRFMYNHTSFNQSLKNLCLSLANFVLTNNYVVSRTRVQGTGRCHVPSNSRNSDGKVVLGSLRRKIHDTAGITGCE